MNCRWKQAFFQVTHLAAFAGVTTGFLSVNSDLYGQSLLPLNLNLSSQRPPMGWSLTTLEPACEVTETSLKDSFQHIFGTGLEAFGFQYVILENCWHSVHEGRLIADPQRFPKGLKSLADILHEKGLKLGLSVPLGSCNHPKSLPPPLLSGATGPHRLSSSTQDPFSTTTPPQDLAALLAEWGVDLVRLVPMKSCDDTPEVRLALYQSFAQTLTSHFSSADGTQPISKDRPRPSPKYPMPVLSLNDPAVLGSGAWALDIAPLWTIDTQTTSDWQGIIDQAQRAARFAAYSGSGHWNETGPLWPVSVTVTLEQKKTQWALWTLLGSPLFIKYDAQHLDRVHRKIITNRELMALYDDRIGLQGLPGIQSDRFGVWIKPIAQSGHRILLIVNKTSAEQSVKLDPLDLGLDGPFMIRDLWEGEVIPPQFQWQLPPFGSTLVKVMGKERPPETGDLLLTDMAPVYAAGLLYRGQGRPGGQGMGSISGIRYSRSLFVKAPSVLRYFLGGKCQRFKSLIGFDDSNHMGSIMGAEVWGDGHLLVRSKSLTQQNPMTTLDADVEGLNYLDLTVQSGGPGFNQTSGSWVHPILSCRGNLKSGDRSTALIKAPQEAFP